MAVNPALHNSASSGTPSKYPTAFGVGQRATQQAPAISEGAPRERDQPDIER
jgi:hypothetical protein